MDLFETLPETYSKQDLKMKLSHFYLEWIYRMDFKYKEFDWTHIKEVENKNNKVLVKAGIAELASFFIKAEFAFDKLIYFIIDQTGKIWLYREHDHRVLLASIKDLNHLMELLNDPILMED